MYTPEKHPGRGGPRRGACRARVGGGCWQRWRGDARSRGLRSARSACSGSWNAVPVLGRSSERPCRVCVCSGGRRAPLTLGLPSPCFPALVISCLWPDISREQMEGDYNEDLCVFRAGLVSQCREPGSPLPISIFHSRFGERSRARGGGCLRGGGLITGLRVSRRASRLGEGLASASPPAGLEPPPPPPNPALFLPPLTPPPPHPLTSGTPVHPLLSLLFALLRVCGNAPFLWPLHPCALCFKGFPGKGTPWPGPTPPPPGARLGDSGESAEPRPTPELGPPALPAPRLAHAKACCVIPTWADIPCPGRSGVGLLIILSAADPRHQPIYCPVSPRWFQEGEGSARKGGEGIVNRRKKAGTSYWHSKKATECGGGGRGEGG